MTTSIFNRADRRRTPSFTLPAPRVTSGSNARVGTNQPQQIASPVPRSAAPTERTGGGYRATTTRSLTGGSARTTFDPNSSVARRALGGGGPTRTSSTSATRSSSAPRPQGADQTQAERMRLRAERSASSGGRTSGLTSITADLAAAPRVEIATPEREVVDRSREMRDPEYEYREQDAGRVLTDMLDEGGRYLGQARGEGIALAARRGMLNSSMAARNSQAAAISAAGPIATATASNNTQTNLSRQGYEQDAALQARDLDSRERLTREQLDSSERVAQAEIDAAARNLGLQLTADERNLIRRIQSEEGIADADRALERYLGDRRIDADFQLQDRQIGSDERIASMRIDADASNLDRQIAADFGLQVNELGSRRDLTAMEIRAEEENLIREIQARFGLQREDAASALDRLRYEVDSNERVSAADREARYDIADLDSQTRLRLQQLDDQTRRDIAGMDLSQRERENLTAEYGDLVVSRDRRLENILANPDLSGEQRERFIAEAFGDFGRDTQVLQGIYDTDLQYNWDSLAPVEAATPTGSLTSPQPAAQGGGGGGGSYEAWLDRSGLAPATSSAPAADTAPEFQPQTGPFRYNTSRSATHNMVDYLARREGLNMTQAAARLRADAGLRAELQNELGLTGGRHKGGQGTGRLTEPAGAFYSAGGGVDPGTGTANFDGIQDSGSLADLGIEAPDVSASGALRGAARYGGVGMTVGGPIGGLAGAAFGGLMGAFDIDPIGWALDMIGLSSISGFTGGGSSSEGGGDPGGFDALGDNLGGASESFGEGFGYGDGEAVGID